MNETVKLAPEWDWKVSAKKALLTGGKTLIGAAYIAVLQWFTTDANVAALLKEYPALSALVPIIAAGCTFLLNRRKQVNR